MAHDQFDQDFAEPRHQIGGLPIPDGLKGTELDEQAYETLATLGSHSQEEVAKLLVMAGQLIDLDPERAYTYAQAAVKRAGRVDIVREAAALTAYATERYQEALREVRAVRRMRNDYSLRAVEADAERGLGKPEKALELIEETDMSQVDLAEQVELVLVAAGARSDLGEFETALVLVENALSKLSEDADPDFRRRLMSAQVDHLRALGREDEANEVEGAIPAEEEDNDILDLKMLAESDVDDVRSDLKGSEEPLSQRYDTVILDLDGVCYQGSEPIPHAAESVTAAVDGGMTHVYVTNNSSRTPKAVAEQLSSLGFPAEPEDVMTSAMDSVKLMREDLEEGAKILVIGGEGLREAVEQGGFTIVESADDEPDAVVQGLDKSLNWERLSEGALAINNGAAFYATNLDASLPTERGFALGNGALVRALRTSTGRKPKASGKPLPGIFHGAVELVAGEHAIAVGDRLETDVAGALSASIPSMHVLTGVHDARDVILADRGLRPQLVHTDLRGLGEPHPRPRHHQDGTWSCGVGQIAKVVSGRLTLDGIVLPEDGVTVTLDSYRALIAAAWDHQRLTDTKVSCPEITVVDNDDPAGILERAVVEEPEVEDAVEFEDGAEQAPEVEQAAEVEETAEVEDMPASDVSEEELANVDVEAVPEFLPGEEDLEALMEETQYMENADEDTEE
ncbi:MAG: HAD-IIA family hydrolase [Actinomycetaceae bacterium]|nr:HAD-IIA family hydrolase [Actinomycetaceae bacterium]